MEDRRMQEEDEEQLKPLRRGWCLGSPEFRERMLEQLEQRAGENPNAEVRRESAVAKAERIVAQELARLGWKEEELVRQRKNAPEKLAIAARLRKETILPLKSIAARVGLGTSKGANRNLHAWMQQTEKQDIRRKEDTVGQQMNRSMDCPRPRRTGRSTRSHRQLHPAALGRFLGTIRARPRPTVAGARRRCECRRRSARG